MSNTYSIAWRDTQVAATQALLKFCFEHQGSDGDYIKSIQACLEALEQHDIEKAASHYQAVPLGGMMCFNDWWPPCVYEYETPAYVSSVFEALTAHWSRLMQLSIPPKMCPACGKEIPILTCCPSCYVHRMA